MTAEDHHESPDDGAEEWPGVAAHDEFDDMEPTSIAGFTPRRFTDDELDAMDRSSYEAMVAEDEMAQEEWRLFVEDNVPPKPNWNSLANQLRDARVRLGISKREAAKRANLSEGAWRHLEKGMKLVGGTRVNPNPRNENLIGIARAVELELTTVFFLAGRPLPAGVTAAPSPDETLAKLRSLSTDDRKLVDQLVNRLLADGAT